MDEAGHAGSGLRRQLLVDCSLRVACSRLDDGAKTDNGAVRQHMREEDHRIPLQRGYPVPGLVFSLAPIQQPHVSIL